MSLSSPQLPYTIPVFFAQVVLIQIFENKLFKRNSNSDMCLFFYY